MNRSSALLEMSETTGESVNERRDRILPVILVPLLLGLLVSAIVALFEHGSPALLLVGPSLVVFWSWVGLGTSTGLSVAGRLLGPPVSWQAYAASLLTALLCGASLYAGIHERVLPSFTEPLRLNPSLLGYYLIWLQFLYFVAAILFSIVASAALRSIGRLQH